MTWREIVPLPSRLWIRYLPRRWPAAREPRLDLVEHRILWPADAAEQRPAGEGLPEFKALRDLVALPPVGEEFARARTNLVAAFATAGVPVLDQRASGESWSAPPSTTPVADLLSTLLDSNLALLDELPENAWIIFPLIPAVSNDPALWADILRRAAARRPLALVGVAPELSPLDRRRLVEKVGEEHFEAIHHANLESGSSRRLERAFAAAVAGAGLNPFVERPQVSLPPRIARNRALATLLAECGERWLSVGRSEAEGAALLAAGRHLESAAATGLDVAALAREGNLAHLGFLSPLTRQVVEGAAGHPAVSPLLAELRAEYTRGEAPV